MWRSESNVVQSVLSFCFYSGSGAGACIARRVCSKHLSLLSPLASPRFVKLSTVPLFPLISAPSENVVIFHKTSLLLVLMCIELIV